MCLKSPISTCRREKYLARTRTKTSFMKSAGWKEKNPKLNQLRAPCDTCPKTKRSARRRQKPKNIGTRTSLRLRSRTSMNENKKKTPKESEIHTACRVKKSPVSSSGANDFMVKSPARVIGTTNKTNSQSIPLEIFFIGFCDNSIIMKSV